MAPSRLPFIVLGVGALVCFGGPHILELGFYHDDWAILSTLSHGPAGFVSRLARLGAQGALWSRPLDAPLWAALYGLFGLRPLGWQLSLLLMNLGAALALRKIVGRFGLGRDLAALAALMFLAYPNKDSTMFWPMVGINTLSLLAFLCAYLLHLSFCETGRRGLLIASAASLAASLGLYDQTALLMPVWLLTPELGRRRRRETLISASVAAAVVAVALAGKFIVGPHLLGAPAAKTFVFSPRHFLFVFKAGLDSCAGPRLIAAVLAGVRDAFVAWPATALSAVLVAGLWSRVRAEPDRDARPLAALGAAFFLLGYLPIAFSDYGPTPNDFMNRVNQVPAVGWVLMIAAGFSRLKPAPRRAAGCALLAVLYAAHVGFAGYWAQSYRRQLAVKAMILEGLPRWPADALLLLLLPERHVAGKAPVFDATWDIGGAARLWTGDPGRRADVVSPRLVVDGSGVFYGSERVPFSRLRLLDARRGRLSSVGADEIAAIRAAIAR